MKVHLSRVPLAVLNKIRNGFLFSEFQLSEKSRWPLFVSEITVNFTPLRTKTINFC